MSEPDITLILTEDERRKIAARVYRESVARVCERVVTAECLAEAKRIALPLVRDAVRQEIERLCAPRGQWHPSMLAGAMGEELKRHIAEYLSTVTIQVSDRGGRPI